MSSDRAADQAGQPGVGRLGLCAGCSFYPDYLNSRRCTPGDACIRAHSGRQIDRFLRNNRELAGDYLSDIFWERRAIAADRVPGRGVRSDQEVMVSGLAGA